MTKETARKRMIGQGALQVYDIGRLYGEDEVSTIIV